MIKNMLDILLPHASEADAQCLPQVTLTLSGTSLDQGLRLVKQFLLARLRQENDADLGACQIDLGVLGTRDYGQADVASPHWLGQTVYPLRLDRSLLHMGPLYRPTWADAPCPHCVERRWFWNRVRNEQVAFMYGRQALVNGHNPKITPFALESMWFLLLTTLRVRMQAGQPANAAYPFSIFNLETLQVSHYDIMQDATCPVCASPLEDTSQAATIELQSRPKRDVSSYRLVKATDYQMPFSAFVNPTTGVLGIEIIPEFTHTLSAPVSGQLKVRSISDVIDPFWSGHGDTYAQSLRLGLLEGLERYAGLIPRGKQVNVFDSYANLAADALDPRTCGLYQPELYERSSRFQPFTPERQIPWVWGYSFRRHRPILVPEELVYYLEHRQDYKIFVHDCSNGCATGSCLEEAIFHGLMELIERDAFLISWYARLSLPRIDPRTCRRPETRFVIENIEKHGYDLFLLDTRLDIRVPSVVSVVRRKVPGLGNIMLAAGSSLDAEDAVRGALCEVACYIRNLTLQLERDEAEMRAMAADYSRMTRVIHHGLLYGLPEMAGHIEFLFQNPTVKSMDETYQDWFSTRPTHQDLRDDLRFCLQMVMDLGMDVIVVDQTCPEEAASGLKTVSVIVPGLMPIDFGWKRERVFDLPRLRTVPRQVGLRETDFVPDLQDVLPHPFP